MSFLFGSSSFKALNILLAVPLEMVRHRSSGDSGHRVDELEHEATERKEESCDRCDGCRGGKLEQGNMRSSSTILKLMLANGWPMAQMNKPRLLHQTS